MRALLAAVSISLSGCTELGSQPDLGLLYSRAASAQDDDRNPVIIIPGILGSKLLDTPSNRLVWGAYSGDFADPETPDGARLLALPLQFGTPLHALRDDVQPDGVLDRVTVDVIGLPIELDAYARILGTLGVGGYRDELLGTVGAVNYGPLHYTCFQFDYDWRRDARENAARLGDYIESRRRYVQEQYDLRFGPGKRRVKFDIVAHSMGGLLARHYVMYGSNSPGRHDNPPAPTWDGAEHVERLILVGTPNAGSVKALTQLVNGTQYAAILPKYQPAILGTMPAIFQLLPRPRHAVVLEDGNPDKPLDILDPGVWERYRWGLLDPEQDRVLAVLMPDVTQAQERRRIAADHLRKSLAAARRFFDELDVPASPPPGLSISLIAGDSVPTDAIIAVDSRTGRLSVADSGPGDGTVTRQSALADQRQGGTWQRELVSPVPWHQVIFLPRDHLGLTEDPVFTDNVLYMLLEAPRRR